MTVESFFERGERAGPPSDKRGVDRPAEPSHAGGSRAVFDAADDSRKVRETADSTIAAELHGSTGDVDTGLIFAFTVQDATYTENVQVAPLDARACTGWLDDDAWLILRTAEGTADHHPIEVRVRLGATPGGRLTAMDLRVVCNIGALGGHAAGALLRAVGESVAPYKCPSKRIEGYAVLTDAPAPGSFLDDGVGQANFAVERAMDDLAGKLGLDPVAFRRMNAIGPADPAISADGSHVRAGGGASGRGLRRSG